MRTKNPATIYATDEVVNRGARTVIYRRRDEGDGRSVILKLLNGTSASADEVVRFRREYELMRSLNLPGVVGCYQLISRDNRHVMVLEDLGGKSLDKLAMAGRIDLLTFLEIANGCARALAGLGERRVVHGNLSPSNIVFNPQSGQLKLIDFGCALDLSDGAADNSARRDEIELSYASPEQVDRHSQVIGRGAAVDHRSDLYSLGVILYELLTGRLPFADGGLLSKPARRPVPPYQLRPEIPERVSDIALKLIEPDPDRRYQSAEELTADLATAAMPEITDLSRKLRRESALREQSLTDLQQAYEEVQAQEEHLREQQEALIAAHAQIEAERHRYQDLFALAPDGYLVTDLHGTIREANQAAVALLGVDARLANGLPLAGFVEKNAERRSFAAFLKRMRGSDDVVEWEGRLVPRGREPVDVVMRCAAVRDELGTTTAARWLIRDVTDRKRREEALRESEEQFRMLAESGQDIVYRSMFVPSPRLDYISPSVTAITGFTQEELYSDPEVIQTLVAGEDVPQVAAMISDPESIVGRPLVRWRRKGGGVVWTEHQITPIYDEDGRVVGATGVARDVTARKLAEDALREREYLIEKITSGSPDLICVFDLPSGHAVYTNRGLAEYLGYTLEKGQALGWEGAIKLAHPDDKQRITLFHQSMLAAADDEVPSIEVRMLGARGDYRWIAIRFVVFARKEDGTVFQVLGTLTDVTERKTMEITLSESETRFRTSVGSMLDAFGIYTSVRDETGKIVDFRVEYANPVISRLYGLSPEEIVGHTLLEFIPRGGEEVLDLYRNVVETGEPLDGLYENRQRFRTFDVRAVRLGDGFVATWRDVTGRKEREQLLREREQFIEHITQVTPGIIYVYDLAERRIVYVNEQVTSLTGLTPEQVLELGPSLHDAMVYSEVVPGPDALQGWVRRAQDGEVVEFEQKLSHVDGSSRWMLTRAVVFARDSTGVPTQMLGAAYDISERKRSEDMIKQANEDLFARVAELSALNRISQLLTKVTDLSSPLASVCETLLGIFNASEASISELDVSRSELKVLAHVTRAPGRPDITGRALALEDDPVARRVVEEGEPVVMPIRQSTHSLRSGQADDRPPAEEGPLEAGGWLYASDMRLLMAQPLRSRGNVIGVLTIAADRDDTAWTMSEALLAQTVAGTIASALATGRLFTEEQKQRLLAESLHEIGSVLAASLDIDTILDAVFGQLKRVLDYDGAVVYLRDGDDIVASRGVGITARHTGYRFLSTSQGAQMRVFASAKPLHIPDSQDDPHWTPPGGNTLRSNPLIRSWMGVPLVIGDNTLGILTVSHRVPHSYSAVHLRLLQSFANVVAIAINNARRYEEAQAIATYEERNRLARELHDSVTQSLFSANLVAEVLPTLAQNNPGVFDKSLEALARFTQSALAEMRTMLMELRPSSLTQAPLDSVIKNLLLTIAGRSQLEIVHPRIDPVPLLQEDAQVALYRIVQESLTNIVKHSQARHAEFELRVSPPFDPRGHDHWEGEITIAIADDGKGFDERAVPQGHMGLQIMRERSASIGASLEISSKPGDGTQVSISWAGAAAVSKRPTADDRR